MKIDWAVFGERNGGHSLLVASANQSFAMRLTQYTDRPGDPPIGTSWGPVDSGFFFEEHYVLLRTMPDANAGRAGMVRSYAAYFPEGKLETVNDLTNIFRCLPNSVEVISTSLEPLEVQGTIPIATSSNIRGLTSFAVRLGSTTSQVPLIWALSAPYIPVVNAIWAKLPASLRRTFAFAFQFAPEHRFPMPATLIATLPALASRWPSEQILPEETLVTTKLTIGQGWLAGTAEGSIFDHILAEYGIQPQHFRDLSLLSSFVDLVGRLPEMTFAEARHAIRILGKFTTTVRSTSSGRQHLFGKLCSLVEDATDTDISTVRNFDPISLSDLTDSLQAKIELRLQSQNTITESLVSNLELASETPTLWWSKPFIFWLHNLARLPTASSTGLAYELLANDKVSKVIEPRIPSTPETEDKLIACLPRKLVPPQAGVLLQLAQKHKWIRLHAICLARSTDAKSAIETHLRMAGNSEKGLILLEEEFGFGALFEVALTSTNDSLVKYSSSFLIQNLECIPEAPPVDAPNWPSILAQAISSNPRESAAVFRHAIVSTLEKLPLSHNGRDELAAACNRSDVALWLGLPDPCSTIESLSSNLRSETVEKLNAYLITKFQTGKTFELAHPERFVHLINVEQLLKGLASVPPQAASRAGQVAFHCLPFLSDETCREWLISLFTHTQYVKLSNEDADGIASILLASYYPKSAEIIRDTVERYSRADVAPILETIRAAYQSLERPKTMITSKQQRLPKVVVATALPLERAEVMSHLGEAKYDWQLFADVAVWPKEHPIFEIYVLATGAGNLAAQGATLRLLNQVKPRMAFFIGVAGGKKDSDEGDVIYSTKVHYYEGGKEADDGLKSRPSSEHSSEALVQLALRVAERDWQPKDRSDGTSKPKATPAVVGSGEKVLTSTSSKASTYQLINQSYNDTQVVDMEAYGFLNAVRTEGVRHGMVIRGVSDRIAGKANADAKGGQPVAARNAAAFLFALLGAIPEMLAAKKGKGGKIAKFLGTLHAL